MTELQTTRFSNQDELEQIGAYKRFNYLAVIAGLLGLASAGMLFSLFLWLVPLLAILFGMLAIARVRRADDLGGGALAVAGIAAALFFTTWAASSMVFARHAVYREATEVAHTWFDLVFSGEDGIAHQAMLHPSTRQAVGLSVDEYYASDEDALKDKEKLFGKPPISKFLGKAGTAELVENVTQDVDLTYAMLIRQVYRIQPEGEEPFEVMVALTRSWKEDLGRATWIVAECSDAE